MSISRDGEVLVRVEGVSKKFCRNLKRALWYGVKDAAADLVASRTAGRELRTDEFWAVEDVSFELRRGECIGILGKNGAGKTTLLKLLNGLVKPDKGRIEMQGRVGAMIALGAGFNPILTGRENIYVNGSILGLSKREIATKIDEIIDFAEIEQFIDSPVQDYSSGMHVRLGFAIAANINPDVLLVDEVLAVGDAGFKIKCYNKMFEIREKTATVFVSHSMPQVGKVCTSGILMKSGRVSEMVPTGDAIRAYLEQFDGPSLSRVGNEAIEIEQVILFQSGHKTPRLLYPPSLLNRHESETEPTAETIMEITCRKKGAFGDIAVLWWIRDLEQKAVAQAISDGLSHDSAGDRFKIRMKIAALNLNRGQYTITLYIVEHRNGGRESILAGLRDFAKLSVRRERYAGEAPILYPNHTELVGDCNSTESSWIGTA